MVPVLAVLASLIQPADMPSVVVTPPEQAASQSQQAVSFMDRYFQHLSSPDVLSAFDRDYAVSINYYGHVVNKAEVMREKARFVHRWPERDYRPRQGSVEATCNQIEGGAVCMVTGLVDFQCRSPERHAVSAGVARFLATIWFGVQQPQIIGEKSEVVGSPSAPHQDHLG